MLNVHEAAAHLRVIVERPADDAPRLVFADRLDEWACSVVCTYCLNVEASGYAPTDFPSHAFGNCRHCGSPCGTVGRVSNGLAEWAEFIRLMCEPGQMPSRALELLHEWGTCWLYNLPGFAARNEHGPAFSAVGWVRGFPERVMGPLCVLEEEEPAKARALFLSSPVSLYMVRFASPSRLPMPRAFGGWRQRDIRRRGFDYVWNHPEMVKSPRLFELIAEHATGVDPQRPDGGPRGSVDAGRAGFRLEGDALDAMNFAATAFGRELAGLPPWPGHPEECKSPTYAINTNPKAAAELRQESV